MSEKSNVTAKARNTSVHHAFLLNLRKSSANLFTYLNHDAPETRANSPIVRYHVITVSPAISTHILVVLLSHNIIMNINNNLIPYPSGRAV